MRQVSGPSRRPSVRHFAWGGRANGNQLVPQAEANVVSQNFLVSTSRKSVGATGLAKVRGLGCSVQGLGARAHRGLGPGSQHQITQPVFRHSEKSRGGGLAKGWESAETAAADVGAWREAGTGYPPYPPPTPPPHPPPTFLGCKGERKRVFTLSVTETIQHAPQGRRILIIGTPKKVPLFLGTSHIGFMASGSGFRVNLA